MEWLQTNNSTGSWHASFAAAAGPLHGRVCDVAKADAFVGGDATALQETPRKRGAVALSGTHREDGADGRRACSKVNEACMAHRPMHALNHCPSCRFPHLPLLFVHLREEHRRSLRRSCQLASDKPPELAAWPIRLLSATASAHLPLTWSNRS